MFSDVVLFHGGGANGSGDTTRNVCSSEKMTQTGDDTPWPAAGQQVASQQQVPQQVNGEDRHVMKCLVVRNQWRAVVCTITNRRVAGPERLTQASRKSRVFCDVTQCRWSNTSRRFGTILENFLLDDASS